MTVDATSDVYYDPWDVDLNADPYPMFKRLRDYCTAVLQLRTRLLRAEPVRRCQPCAGRSPNLQLRQGSGDRDSEGQHRDSARYLDLRRPPDPRHPPQSALPCVHATQDECHRALDPRVHRALPRSPCRRRSDRLRQASRRGHAAACCRHALRHPRALPEPCPGPSRQHPHRARRKAGPFRRNDRRAGVRRVHRLADGQSLRRPHLRAPRSRVRRRNRDTSATASRRTPDVHECRLRRRCRDNHPPDRLVGKAAVRPSRSTPPTGRRSIADPGRHRRDPEIRAAGVAGRAVCHPRYRRTTDRPFPRAAPC